MTPRLRMAVNRLRVEPGVRLATLAAELQCSELVAGHFAEMARGWIAKHPNANGQGLMAPSRPGRTVRLMLEGGACLVREPGRPWYVREVDGRRRDLYPDVQRLVTAAYRNKKAPEGR